ncbi:hypothetical protein [Brevundimonas sp.]|uniref:hypothetical protein n=1 Tax=Brevundimonas sp. TaxID=1871086 RepID=UPI00356767F3
MGRLNIIAATAVLIVSSPALMHCAPLPSFAQSDAAPLRSDVRRIVNQIASLPRGRASAERQQGLFDELIAIGSEGVPTLIALMDDRRQLPWSAISLKNRSPDAFEGIRHYGPELMVDALAAVLNQITGEHFGFIYNGASNADRAASVAAWREYLKSRLSSDLQAVPSD